MTKAAKIWAAVIAGLLVVVAVLVIVLIVTVNGAERARQEDECRERYAGDVYSTVLCQERID